MPVSTTQSATSIFTDAHTAYQFTDAPVTDEDLAAIYDLAKFAPTAMNAQPLRITFVRTEAAKARLLPLLAEFNRQKSASAPVVAILSADLDFHENMPELMPQRTGVRENLAADEANRIQMARNNAWLQAGAFIFAVRAAGLDAGPMAGMDAAGIDREFHPNTALSTFLIVNIGHAAPEGFFPRNPRLSFDQAVSLA